MKKFAQGLLAAAAICAVGAIATPEPSIARPTGGMSFSIILGDAMFGYSDGYYDRDRRWHRWRNSQERRWYEQNHRDSYFGMRRDRDRDSYRRDWRSGKRQDWRGGDHGDHGGH
jgi:hypothetical protein